MVHIRQKLGVSERRACKVLNQLRSVQRYQSKKSEEEEVLRGDIVRLAGILTAGTDIDVLQHSLELRDG